jgi:multicomponent Na+:H+ antiporter subunit B
MNDSLIFRVTARLLLPLLLLLALFMLIRGHNLPGGGFIGGLLAASSLIIYMLAFGIEDARRALPVSYRALTAVGVLIAGLSGASSWLAGLPFQTGLWFPYPIPGIGKIGTPVIFDLGVCLTVLGVMALIAFALAEVEEVPFEPRFEGREP